MAAKVSAARTRQPSKSKSPVRRKAAGPKAVAKASSARGAKKPAGAKPGASSAPRKASAPAQGRMTLAEVMSILEKAGSAQTRKIYARHGASEPMFGVSFASMKTLVKRIGVDQELAMALWNTGNWDARTLAVKIADPARMSRTDLDRWANNPSSRMGGGYFSFLVAEGPHGRDRAEAWLSAKDEAKRDAAWSLVGALALRDESLPDNWFSQRLAEIERSIHGAPNGHRRAMLDAVIAIGCRSASLRKAATAAAKRIGKVEIDHGETQCKTPEPVPMLDKSWTYSKSKGFDSPAAQERARESIRTRC